MKKIVKLTPTLMEKPWGGVKLKEIYKSDLPNIGETWEVSTHPNGVSFFGDRPLTDFGKLDYLIKFIDTNDNLSVQVHPDDEYAQKHEGDNGKPECWFILNAEKGAGVYLGFKEGVDKEKFQYAVEHNEDVSKLLNLVEVKAGDFINLPPGSVHAIGKGVTLCEVQRSSDITYRVWDWNRADANGNSRELHLDKAMDVLNFDESFNKKLLQEIEQKVFDKDFVHNLGDEIQIEVSKTQHLFLQKGDACIEPLNFSSYFCLDDSELNLETSTTLLHVRNI